MTRLLGTCIVDRCMNYEDRYGKGKCKKHAKAERIRMGVNRTRSAGGQGLGAKEVLDRVCGLSYRQLDHWTTIGMIQPSNVTADGSGTRRRWSEADVEDLQQLTLELSILEPQVKKIRNGTRWTELLAARNQKEDDE